MISPTLMTQPRFYGSSAADGPAGATKEIPKLKTQAEQDGFLDSVVQGLLDANRASFSIVSPEPEVFSTGSGSQVLYSDIALGNGKTYRLRVPSTGENDHRLTNTETQDALEVSVSGGRKWLLTFKPRNQNVGSLSTVDSSICSAFIQLCRDMGTQVKSQLADLQTSGKEAGKSYDF